MHDVERVVEERKPVGDADVNRHEPSRRDEVIERPVKVHRARDDGDIALPHPSREGAGATADVEADSDRSRWFGPQDAVDPEVEIAVVVFPPDLLPAVQVEAILAVVGSFGLASVN